MLASLSLAELLSGESAPQTHICSSGPTPRVVASAADNVIRSIDTRLRIVRDGRPVQNVLLGERLRLVIESSIDGKVNQWVNQSK